MSQQPQLTPEQQKELEEKLKNMSPEEIAELQKQQCIFCQIIAGKIPSKKVFEDDEVIAVLDINPAAKGHVLVITKEHYAIMPQIPDEKIGHLFTVSKKISQALLRGLKVTGTSIFVTNGLAAGQRAQHFMIHVIPRRDDDGLLGLDEKEIPNKEYSSAFSSIDARLRELLGKPKQDTQTKLDEKEDSDEEVEEAQDETEENEGSQEDEVEDNEAEDEDDSEDEDTDEDSEVDDEDAQEKDSGSDAEDEDDAIDDFEEDEDSEESDNKKEDVSLDDIADLFK